jgi:RNA polymerase-binding transcription factor DksA
MEKGTVRYSSADLQEFQQAVEARLAKAKLQIQQLEAQLEDLYENNSNGYDLDDNGSLEQEKELLQTMLMRQRKHSVDLNNALIRIHNRTYGICEITGELIDKRRLLAVPTTTKSLQAKERLQAEAMKGQLPSRSAPKRTRPANAVITTVVRRKAANPALIDTFDDLDYQEDNESLAEGYDDDDDNLTLIPFDEEVEY